MVLERVRTLFDEAERERERKREGGESGRVRETKGERQRVGEIGEEFADSNDQH